MMFQEVGRKACMQDLLEAFEHRSHGNDELSVHPRQYRGFFDQDNQYGIVESARGTL